MLKLFPWENGEKPYWVNPENGVMWFVDKSMTDWCSRETLNKLPKLDAVCFYVCKKVDDIIKPIERVLVDRDSGVLAAEISVEAMAANIDWLSTSLHFNQCITTTLLPTSNLSV